MGNEAVEEGTKTEKRRYEALWEMAALSGLMNASTKHVPGK